MNDIESGAREPDEASNAVGIIVQDGPNVVHRPRAVAFVWGGEARFQPSLPYGRWKTEIRPAA